MIRRALPGVLCCSMAVALASGPLYGEVPTEGLVAFFPFNGNADDESGNGNHGTVFGASLASDRFGIPGRAYRFDGVDDYILANADNLPTAERTLSLWFRADRLDNRPGLLGYGGGACGTTWFMGVNNGGAARQYQMQGHCLANRVRAGYGPKPVGRWMHWLMTTDGTGTKLYLDGVEIFRNGTFVTNTNVTGRDLALGVWVSPGGAAPFTDGNSGYFDGRLDDVVIYDRALEPAEVEGVFAGALPENPVLYFPFSGSASDESGNENDGFVIGATLSEDRFGNPQSAYDFDGVDDYIRAGADGLPTGERTVSFWFYADGVGGRPGLLGYGGGNCGTSWLMGINNGGADNQFQLQGHCLSNLLRSGYGPEPVSSWHHWVIQTNPEGTRILLDGELFASNGNFVTNTQVAGRDLSFGVIPSPSGVAPFTDVNVGYFDGQLDDIAIYNRSLDGDEIRALLQDGDPAVIFSNGFESGDAFQWTEIQP